MKRLGMSLAGVATATALVIGGGGLAYADNLVVIDTLEADVSSINLGDVPCAATPPASASVDLAIKRAGSSTGENAFVASSTVALSVSTITGVGLSATDPGQLTLPANWGTIGNTVLSDAVSSTITVASSVEGPHNGSIKYTAIGRNSDGDTFSRDDDVDVTWNVLECDVVVPDNTAPVVVLTCPTDPVLRGSAAGAAWVATDAGGSGLAGASSGTIPLDTSAYGAATATAALGTAVDNAGNKSAVATCGYFVTENTPPIVELTCPTEPVTQGETAYAEWSASDEVGGSGLATASTGHILLDTSTLGVKIATAPAGTAVDNAGNESVEQTCGYTVVDRTKPVVVLTCPANPVLLDSTVAATWTATDEDGGSGLATAASGQITLDTSSVGSKTASAPVGTAVDNAGNESVAVDCAYSVVYDFDGFYRPVDMHGVVNSVKAGSAVPIKFSLDGDQGLDILATGSPTITFTACKAGAEVDPIETTVTAGGSSLSYDPVADQYVYVWKTVKTWAGKCGTFTLTLDDGTPHSALFTFTK